MECFLSTGDGQHSSPEAAALHHPNGEYQEPSPRGRGGGPARCLSPPAVSVLVGSVTRFCGETGGTRKQAARRYGSGTNKASQGNGLSGWREGSLCAGGAEGGTGHALATWPSNQGGVPETRGPCRAEGAATGCSARSGGVGGKTVHVCCKRVCQRRSLLLLLTGDPTSEWGKFQKQHTGKVAIRPEANSLLKYRETPIATPVQ